MNGYPPPFDKLPVWSHGPDGWPPPRWCAGWRAWCESGWARTAPVPWKRSKHRYGK